MVNSDCKQFQNQRHVRLRKAPLRLAKYQHNNLHPKSSFCSRSAWIRPATDLPLSIIIKSKDVVKTQEVVRTCAGGDGSINKSPKPNEVRPGSSAVRSRLFHSTIAGLILLYHTLNHCECKPAGGAILSNLSDEQKIDVWEKMASQLPNEVQEKIENVSKEDQLRFFTDESFQVRFVFNLSCHSGIDHPSFFQGPTSFHVQLVLCPYFQKLLPL